MMALVALSVLAVGAPVAQASHADDTMADAECVLNANQVAGSAAAVGENGVNHVGNPMNLMGDFGNGQSYDVAELFDTDPGHFDFSGTAICEGRDVAAEGPAPDGPPNALGPQIIPPGTYNIEAAGDFDNLICGTGTANGDAVIRGPGVQIYTEFAIKFNGGVGGGTTPPFTGKLVFVVDADNTGVDNGGGQLDTAPSEDQGINYVGHSFATVDGNENQIDGGGGTGDVTITPSVGNCVNQNVTQFFVNGKFEGFLSGEGSTVSDDNPGTPTPGDPSDDSDG